MSSFKDMVSSDLNVVLNIEEFGEEHTIDGEIVTCVIDNSALINQQGGADYAVAQSYIILFAKCADLPYRKGFGAELMIDGVPYIVDRWDEDMGMATVKLAITFNA